MSFFSLFSFLSTIKLMILFFLMQDYDAFLMTPDGINFIHDFFL
jgi:hypothetical protein